MNGTEGARTAASPSRPVAVIDMGSSAIRLVVAEIVDDGSWRRLDRAERPVPLGRDVFVSGQLSSETVRQAVKILSGFRELLRGWQIPDENIRVVATSAIREARNRDTFIDRVHTRTGFRVEIVEGIEENHLTYLAVQHALRAQKQKFARSSTMILEVGGGTSELMLLKQGKVVAAHSLRLGTVRIDQQVLHTGDLGAQIQDYLRENVRVTTEILDAELPLHKVRLFVAVGGDARIAARAAGTTKDNRFAVIRKSDFEALLERLQKMGRDDIVRDLGITYNEAEGLVPALFIYKLFLDATSAAELVVPDVSIREGVLVAFATVADLEVERELYSQVVASALSLGRKYHFDEEHAVHVARLALQLFDQLQDEHGMDQHERMILEVGAILHDIGNYIRTSGHHKHGHYIVANSEIFGLSRPDILVVSHLVRYHRKALPSAAHGSYAALRRENRIRVLKLAAILRVADALDRDHSQRITGARVERQEDSLLLHCERRGDITIVKNGMARKANLFEEVFGYPVYVV